MSLINEVESAIIKHKLLSKGENIIVGVSGGMDSVCLFHLLNQFKHKFGIRLIIAHFNHKLRKSSDKDEAFVLKLAEQYNTPFYTKSWIRASKPKGSIEDLARRQRQKFFLGAAKKYQTNIVALAHNKNDVAETVLMRFIRGSGLNGLKGISAKRMIGEVEYIRPLINSSRDDIENYISKNNLGYVTDETNSETVFFRNHVRLDLLPGLKKNYNPNIIETLSSLSDTVTLDYQYIEAQANLLFDKISIIDEKKQEICFSLKNLNKQHRAIVRMLIRLSFERMAGNMNQLTLKHITEVEDLIAARPVNSIVNLPKQFYFKKLDNFLVFAKAKGLK